MKYLYKGSRMTLNHSGHSAHYSCLLYSEVWLSATQQSVLIVKWLGSPDLPESYLGP